MAFWPLTARPNLESLKKRTRDLLRRYKAGDAKAADLFRQFHPAPPTLMEAQLSDAQLAIARSFGFPSWPRFMVGFEMFKAICADDERAVLAMVEKTPALLRENVRGEESNWGPPLACAVQVRARKVIDALLPIPDQNLHSALGRALLHGETRLARRFLAAGAAILPGEVMGPCETLNPAGLKFLLDNGAPLSDPTGDRLAPLALVLGTYSRSPKGKHKCLEILNEHIPLPDTPVMAMHRGRIDLLERHFSSDQHVLTRRFSSRDIYPPALGCKEEGLHGTPLDGSTLMHMAIDFDEIEVLRWLLSKGADVNARASVNPAGFGGHTPLFNAVVLQQGAERSGLVTRLLLASGADPTVRASIRKGHRYWDDETEHEYHNVTAAEYGRAYHAKPWVNPRALGLVERAARRAERRSSSPSRT